MIIYKMLKNVIVFLIIHYMYNIIYIYNLCILIKKLTYRTIMDGISFNTAM